MRRPCSCDNTVKDKSPWIRGKDCWLCWLYWNSEGHKKLWDELPDVGNKEQEIDPKMTCKWLGNPTKETVDCPSCSGKIKLKLYECRMFRLCTIGKKVGNIACCKGCPKKEIANG